jgi:hypothetical protein
MSSLSSESDVDVNVNIANGTNHNKRKKYSSKEKSFQNRWLEDTQFKGWLKADEQSNSIFQTKVRKWFLADRRQRL